MAHGLEGCAACDLERQVLAASVKANLLGIPRSAIRLGAFEVERCLGRGSAGVVFAAIDTRTGAEVALKHFHAPMVPAEVKREFRTLAHLSHPNLVRLHELFAEQGRWFFTMELVAGSNFRAHVRTGRADGVVCDERPLRDALAQLLRGVAAIHAGGHVHRDLKPANALVARDGRVVILDYGLMRTLTFDSTYAGGIAGTPGYIAPEQRHGERPSAAGDMYSVGVMLFEALTGGALPARTQANAEGDAPRASEYVRHVPPDLDALCARLMSADPALRPSADTALATLEQSAVSTHPATGQGSTPASRERFVGRKAQLEALRAQWREALAGHARIVLLEGESGIGKSALLRRFCGELDATSEALVLEGRCYEREHIRFNLFDDIVQELADHLLRLPERERLLCLPRQLTALATLFPAMGELARRYDPSLKSAPHAEPQGRDLPVADAHDVRLQAFTALRELLTRIRDVQPIVISIDDLQWSDHDSLRMLQFLLSAPHAPALLLVASMRSGERQGDPLLSGFLREPSATALEHAPVRLALEAFTGEEFDELLGSLEGQPLHARLREQILRESRCIPFLVRELAEYHATSRGEATDLAALLRERYSRQGAQEQRLLDVLCVAQRPLPLEVALDASGLSRAAAAVGVELCDAKLAKPTRPHGVEHLEIYHDRLREALHEGLDRERVRVIHEHIADALETSHSGEVEDQVQHRLLAGQPEQAARLAAVAAERAAHHLRWNRAAALLQMALQWSGADPGLRRHWLDQLGAALSSAGRFSEAADAYIGLLAMQSSDPDGRVTGLACQQLLRAGRLGEGIDLIDPLYRRLGLYFPESNANRLVMYLRARATVRLNVARGWKARKSLEPMLAHKLEALETVLVELAALDPMRARIVHGQFLGLAFGSGDRERILHALLLEISHVSYLHGKLARGRVAKLLKMVATAAAESDTPYARALQWMAEGIAAYATRESPGQALAAFRRADELLSNERPSTHFMREMLAEYRSIVAELTGDFQDLTSLAATRLPDQAAIDYSLPVVMQGVPLSLLVNDRPDEAARFLDIPSRTDEVLLLHYFRVIRAADVAFYSGEFARADQLIVELSEKLRGSLLYRSPMFRHSFAFYRARCAAARFFERREARYRLEVSRCEREAQDPSAPRYNRGFVRLLCAGVAVADGRPRDARSLLEQAALDFSLSEAQNGAVCAQYRLAQLDGAHDELRRARGWFEERGVVDPEKWVSVWAPMPKAGAA